MMLPYQEIYLYYGLPQLASSQATKHWNNLFDRFLFFFFFFDTSNN